MTPLSQRKSQLNARLAELTGRLDKIEGELATHTAQDWEDLATERETDEVLEGMGINGQQEIRTIRAALARVQAGDYGTCTQCGATIDEARLDVLPYTPFCKDCAATVHHK